MGRVCTLDELWRLISSAVNGLDLMNDDFGYVDGFIVNSDKFMSCEGNE